MLEYDEGHPDFPLESQILVNYMQKWVMLSIMWGICGSLKLRDRSLFSQQLSRINTLVDMPNLSNNSLIDYEVKIEDGEWSLWKKKVP